MTFILSVLLSLVLSPVGRFLSADPLGHAATMDLYSFAGGDPVNRFDPDGRFARQIFGLNSFDDISNIGDQIRREEQFIAAASGLVDMIPLIGGAKMWVELNTGKDLFTGERQDQNQYLQAAGVALNFLSVLPAAISLAGETTMLAPGAGLAARELGTEAALASESGTTTTSTGVGQSVVININMAEETFAVGEITPGGQVAGVGPGAMYVGESIQAEGQIAYGALDSLGRPTGVQASITSEMLGTGTRASQSITPPGWAGNGTEFNQARGHLLGSQLGGSGSDARNIVTIQQQPANTPIMRDFETEVRQAVEGGQTVNYSVTPVYNGNNLIPRGLTIQASGSDGYNLGVTILNPPGR
jgi:hypothetical protein